MEESVGDGFRDPSFSQIGMCGGYTSGADVPGDGARATTRKVLTENAVVVLEAIESAVASVGPTRDNRSKLVKQ